MTAGIHPHNHAADSTPFSSYPTNMLLFSLWCPDSTTAALPNVEDSQEMLSDLSFQRKRQSRRRASNDHRNTPQKHQEQQQQQQRRRSLLGALDPEGNVEVIFYDARQYEDDLMRSLRGGTTVDGIRENRPPPSTPSSNTSSNTNQANHKVPPPPPPPTQLPLRFLRAGKGDPVEGRRRYEQTLQWRKQHQIDTILRRPSPHFALIKQHYLHYIHLRGKQNEPVFYEKPAKTNLKALRAAGISVDDLLLHYCAVIEYLWQWVDPSDSARSIYILDLEGIKLGDFAGDVFTFVQKASKICNEHFPERAGFVFCINVPRWFHLIWRVVQPWVDESTLQKITIFRGTPKETAQLLQDKIPLQNLPEEYGGTSGPLGSSPEEETLARWMAHNNNNKNAALQQQQQQSSCAGPQGGCEFCSWTPARSY